MPNKGTPGWHPSPTNPSEERYWDGTAWTGETRTFNANPTTPASDAQKPSAGRTIIGIAAVVAIGFAIVRCNADDNDAAAALNKHINSVGGALPGWSVYEGTEPTGGKGAVAIQTSLGEDAGSRQSAGAMCGALVKDRAAVPGVKKVSIRSSTGYPIWSCW